MTPGLASVGYRGLPDLLAVMRAGSTGIPDVSQADVFDSDVSTAQTIAKMVLLIRESCGDPLMQQVSMRAVQSFGPLAPGGDAGDRAARSVAWGVWWAVKHMMKFVQDSPAITKMFGPNDALELLISPAVMIRSRQMEGDCDDYTMMICAMLDCCGVPWEICTVAASIEDPSRYSHVYPRAALPDGTRIVLDASHGKYPGWEVPKSRQFRLQVWDENGNAISNDARSQWDGLHGYENRRPGMGAIGCLDYDEDGNCIDDDSGDTTLTIPTTPAAPVTCGAGYVNFGGVCIPAVTNQPVSSTPPSGTTFGPIGSSYGCAPGYVVADNSGTCAPASSVSSSGAVSPLDSVLANLATTWSKIAGQTIAPQTTVCNSAGVCTTGPANSASTVAAANALGIPSSYLMIGALAVGVLIFISVMKK